MVELKETLNKQPFVGHARLILVYETLANRVFVLIWVLLALASPGFSLFRDQQLHFAVD